MTETEKKALALVNEVSDGFHDVASIYDIHTAKALRSALCRAIEQHEAFKRDVSDAIQSCMLGPVAEERLSPFILPKPVDPLVEALREVVGDGYTLTEEAKALRAALAKRNAKIVWEAE